MRRWNDRVTNCEAGKRIVTYCLLPFSRLEIWERFVLVLRRYLKSRSFGL
jgi:hypothetical protein